MIQLLLYYFIWKIYLCFSTKNGEPREAALPIVSAHFLSLWLFLSIKIWVFFFVWCYGCGYLCWLFLHCGCHKTFVFLVQAAEININCRSFVSYTHTHPFNGPFSGTTRVSLYQKGKTNLDFTEARDSEWQWHQLGHMQVCTLLQTDNHASTPPLSFLHAGCPSCRPTNSVKAVKVMS